MIEQIVSGRVAAVETERELVADECFPEEQGAVRWAVEPRRREFMTGRVCARRALRKLGVPPTVIPSGERGEPLWPAGVVGSITHCRGYRACAVARSQEVVSIGIDAEVHEPLPDGILEDVARPRERAWARHGRRAVCADRLLFSAKEAVYKAWFPLTGGWLGFEDVELSFDGGGFRAALLVPGPVVEGRRLTEIEGRWAVRGDCVLTAVVLGRR